MNNGKSPILLLKRKEYNVSEERNGIFMKTSLFFQVLISALVICSSFYIQYRKNYDTVQAMSTVPEYVKSYNSNMTFSDLVERCQGEKND